MKLFISPGACSLSPHIILAESGLHYTLETVNLKTRKTASGLNFDQVNPKGYVPLLEIGAGAYLSEGPAIVQYIADQVPDKKLVPPAGTMPRYALQAWLTFIGTELHKSFSPFFNPKAGEDWKQAAMNNLRRRLDYVNEALTGKDYLMGADFTVADAYLFTVLSWTRYIKLDLSEWAQIPAYVARINERPAVKKALEAEMAAKKLL